MTERQQKILELIVKEYVDNLKPISSKLLSRKLGLSSATLRNEMLELDKTGHLNQPHTSAGRIPTEKAYRFFIKLSGGNSEETFEEQFNYLFKRVGHEETRVFIDKKIPMVRTKKYSLIITGYKTPSKKREIIGLLGPTRMRYDYNIALINKLREMLEDYD
jgi:heat-inducible transcriptional repressor